jgi:Fe2+ or Zn2+ uptake regulation protein
MPEWYQEINKELNAKSTNMTPAKKAIIDYLKEQIKLLEND